MENVPGSIHRNWRLPFVGHEEYAMCDSDQPNKQNLKMDHWTPLFALMYLNISPRTPKASLRSIGCSSRAGSLSSLYPPFCLSGGRLTSGVIIIVVTASQNLRGNLSRKTSPFYTNLILTPFLFCSSPWCVLPYDYCTSP